MIRFFENCEINFEKWDQCIENSLNGMIYPYSFYLDRVSPGWCALIEGNYDCVMPLPAKKKWGYRYIVQPSFVQQLGVFSPLPLSKSTVEKFIKQIPKEFIYVNYNLNTFNDPGIIPDFKFRQNKTFVLDLNLPYPQLHAAFSTNIKRNIRKAKKLNVFVLKNSDPHPIIKIFRQNRGITVRHLNDHHYKVLLDLVQTGIMQGYASTYSAYGPQNNLCAGAFFLHSHKRSILLFSATSSEARQNGAMASIINNFIIEHSQNDRMLDFEGSNDANLAKFYAGFGSKEYVYLQAIGFGLPKPLKMSLNLYLNCRNWISGY